MDDLVVVSNRGPLTFGRDDHGSLVSRQGGGGLVSSLGPLLAGTGATWVAAAMSDDDRAAVAQGLMQTEGLRLRVLALDPATFSMAYDVVANATLWFLYHGLFDLPRRPRFDRRWAQAWSAYVEVNEAFAAATAEVAPPGATVLVQDYHLALVPKSLRDRRPDLRIVHFSHTPFVDPSALAVLPSAQARDLLEGMTAGMACGFHAQRWADAFEACCSHVLGRAPSTFVASLGPDLDHLRRVARSPEVAQRQGRLDQVTAGRQVILRVDRMEPSKNLVRGFLAYEELLAVEPDLHSKVTFLALAYASREGLADYLAYRAEVETTVERINRALGTQDWLPIVLDVSDDYPRSIAALTRYDVLLVNPVRDGLNLVAKEGPLLNTADGTLVLSHEAGAWSELASAALGTNPFDLAETAGQLARGLHMAPAERAERAAALREAAGRRTNRDWLNDQLAAAQGN